MIMLLGQQEDQQELDKQLFSTKKQLPIEMQEKFEVAVAEFVKDKVAEYSIS